MTFSHVPQEKTTTALRPQEGATVWGIFSHSPASGPSGPSRRPRRRRLSPPPPAWVPGEATDRRRTSIMFVSLWYHFLPKCQLHFAIFLPLSPHSLGRRTKRTRRRPMPARRVLVLVCHWAARSCRSQLVMMPPSSSKVVVLTMWLLPTRISWVPSSLVRGLVMVPSIVKTRS